MHKVSNTTQCLKMKWLLLLRPRMKRCQTLNLFLTKSHVRQFHTLSIKKVSVVDCRASTEAYQVACDRCEAEFIVPVAVSSAPAPASGTGLPRGPTSPYKLPHVSHPLQWARQQHDGQDAQQSISLYAAGSCFTFCVAIFGAWLCFGSFTASFVQRCRLQSINGGLSSGLRPL
ncbi:hypothetical protein MRX96_030445 [Rhipicephalus microplus]